MLSEEMQQKIDKLKDAGASYIELIDDLLLGVNSDNKDVKELKKQVIHLKMGIVMLPVILGVMNGVSKLEQDKTVAA